MSTSETARRTTAVTDTEEGTADLGASGAGAGEESKFEELADDGDLPF